jgi:integrase
VREKLKKLQAEADAGLKTSASYSVAKAVDDWAAEALGGLADKTVRSHVDLLRPVTMLIGNVPLRDLTAQDVRRTLSKLAQTRSTRTMASTHNVLVRAIRHAEANDHVGRNVASLVKPPQGKTGRRSRAMTAAEAAALLTVARDHPRLGAYVILSLTTGIRTEEARALRWDHVDLDGDPDARTPVPPNIAVWRSVRLHGDTKTEKVPADPGLAAECRDGATRAPEVAGSGAPGGRAAVAGHRPGIHHKRGHASGCLACPA